MKKQSDNQRRKTRYSEGAQDFFCLLFVSGVLVIVALIALIAEAL